MNELRPYQADFINTSIREFNAGITKQLGVLFTGAGKTFTGIKLIERYEFKRVLWLSYQTELVSQSAMAFIRDGYPEDYQAIKDQGFLEYVGSVDDPVVGCIKGHLFKIDAPVIMGSVKTVWNRLDKLDPYFFDCIVADECFPAGTLIDGKPIEQIKVGDIVRSYNHKTKIVEYRPVATLFKNKPQTNLVKITFKNGTSFTCTENHPIFTLEFGYMSAKKFFIFKELVTCILSNEANPCIQSTVQNMRSDSDFYHEIGKKQVSQRLSLLQRKVFSGKAKRRHEKNSFENRFQKNVGKNDQQQPDEKSSIKRQNGCFSNWQNFFIKGWKRNTVKTPTNASSGNWVGNGIRYTNIACKRFVSIITNSLQGRFSSAGSQTCNRSRWKQPPMEEVAFLRQTEDRNIEFVRVASVEIYECGGGKFDQKMREDHNVYNFEVEGNHNYFANGILVHNCHLFGAKSAVDTINFFKPRLLLGLTATPHRQDGMMLGDIFDKIVFEYGLDKGIKEGWACELEGIRVKTTTSLDKVRTTAGELNQGDLADEVNTLARNQLIVEKYKQYADGRQAIAYCVDIQHAVDLAEQFRMNGIDCKAVSSNEEMTPERSENIKAFTEGKLQVITNVNILVAGFDHPDTGCMIMACPTKSLTKYLQAVGRGARLKSDAYVQKYGQRCIILDIVDVTSRHNLINAWELDKQKPPEDRIFITSETREKLLEARRTRLEVQRDKDEVVKLLPIPKLKISTSIRMTEEATAAQLAVIEKWGYDVKEVHYTKKMVAEIFAQQPATAQQVVFLKNNGYDIASQPEITLGMFQEAKRQIDNRPKFSTK